MNFFIELTNRFFELAMGPINNKEMLWVLIPLLINLFFIEIYSARYKSEKIGWVGAFGNSIILLFVAMDLLRHLYNRGDLVISLQISLIFALFFIAVLMAILDFFHSLPKELAYVISSESTVHFLAAILILIIYTNSPIDIYTILSIFILILIYYMVITILNWITPTAKEN